MKYDHKREVRIQKYIEWFCTFMFCFLVGLGIFGLIMKVIASV